ncbi:membrane protein [Litoreibacter roseus]|uniref:Probable membrane transporter protein n=2 Tax=Litoreibacter roseus TaxID=2601869 RepID=A0A6N6JMI9_9RHOB|nr:membrane protein [Litoreibacter roseus]
MSQRKIAFFGQSENTFNRQLGFMESYLVLSYGAVVGAVCVMFIGGFLKGATGFGMPMIVVSGMSFLTDPKMIVASLVLPLLVTNLIQIARGGLRTALSVLREHWRYILLVCIGVIVSSQFIMYVESRMMYLLLGGPIVALSFVQLLGVRCQISDQSSKGFETVASLTSGVLGGLAGSWGPPTVLYLLAVNTPKAKQMIVQGVIYGCGSVVLLVGHLQSGLLTEKTLGLSAFFVIPAILGMAFGFRFGDRMNHEIYRKTTLALLLLIGANLVGRGATF